MNIDLKSLRKDIGKTQQELADHLGILRVRLSQIENGKATLTPGQLKKISELVEDIGLYQKDRNMPSSSIDPIITQKLLELQERINNLKEMNRLKDEIIKSKESQLKLLEGNYSPQSISVVQNNEKGKFVDWKMVDIPTDQYFEIQEGIFDRVMTESTNIIESWETVFLPHLSKIDFDRYMVILNKSKKGSLFPLHYHVEPETIICVQGSFRELLQRRRVDAGERIEFRRLQEHEVLTLEDSYLIILIEKIQKN